MSSSSLKINYKLIKYNLIFFIGYLLFREYVSWILFDKILLLSLIQRVLKNNINYILEFNKFNLLG
jgi:hypothetical protein